MKRGLFLKYVILFVGLVTAVLTINAALDLYFVYQDNRRASIDVQHEKAEAAAQKVESFVREIEHQIGWVAYPQWAMLTVEQRRFEYVRLLRQVPAITELTQLDRNGHEQLKVSRLSMDVVGSDIDRSTDPAFTEAVAHKVYFGPVYYRKESEPYLSMAVAHGGRNGGVTVAEINLKLILDVITLIKVGKDGYAYVVDRLGRLVAHPDISLVLRGTDMNRLAQVAAARAPQAPAEQAGQSKDLAGRTVLSAHAEIPALNWLVFVELPSTEVLQPVVNTGLRDLALLVLGILIAGAAAALLARRMVVPIRAMQAGAERIGGGDLGHRLSIKTGDELEALADQFNRSAEALEESHATLEQRVEDRTRELTESLEQQTATAEILRVISQSPTDVRPVLDAVVSAARRFCGAADALIALREGADLVVTAHEGPLTAPVGNRRPLDRSSISGRAMVDGRTIHTPDIAALDPAEYSTSLALSREHKFRAALGAPMLREGVAVGSIVLRKPEPGEFTPRQIELLETFAAQAVIAIENVRLFTELGARNSELTESLEQQTATAEILRVISQSPTDVQPVLAAVASAARRFCGATDAVVILRDGDVVVPTAHDGPITTAIIGTRHPIDRRGVMSRVMGDGRTVHVPNFATLDPAENPTAIAMSREHKFQASVTAPMLREGVAIGAIVLRKLDAGEFTPRQIGLLETFAAQAVIAIENVRLFTELREALEQQTATADVLGVINSSPGDLAPVFDAMLEKAVRLCEADSGHLALPDGEDYRTVAAFSMSPEMEALIRAQSYAPGRGTAVGRALLERSAVQINDIAADPEHAVRHAAEKGLIRTILGVPLLREGEPIGAFGLSRARVEPFTERQIELVRTFADQAVIAMENARLIIETRESLEQQTASAEILQVISQSPTDVKPVLDVVASAARRFCGAVDAMISLRDGSDMIVASHEGPFLTTPQLRRPLDRTLAPARAIVEAETVHLPDVMVLDPVEFASTLEAARANGARSALAVPMLREGEAIGSILLRRRESGTFTPRQIELAETFAAQAVIAIENVRLFTELSESLDQQTATAEVLQTINASPGDATPVFDAILEKAMALCQAAFGMFHTYDGQRFDTVATRGVPERFTEYRKSHPADFGPGTGPAQLVAGAPFVQVADLTESEAYKAGEPNRRALVELGGGRALLNVPLRKEGVLLGAFAIYRKEARPFADKQIALLQGFAAQAVIAMENARLITEQREALEQQTATAEILRVISQSPTDVQPVLDVVVMAARRFCGAADAIITLRDGADMLVAAHEGPLTARVGEHRPLDRSRLTGRAIVDGLTTHIPDVAALDPEEYHTTLALARDAKFLSAIAAPMLREGVAVGSILLRKSEVGEFTPRQIELLETFAAQAVIAIENVRLFTELRESLDQQTASAEILHVISQSPTDVVPVLKAIAKAAVRFCGATDAVINLRESADVVIAAHEGDLSTSVGTRFPLDRSSSAARAITDGQTIHLPDINALDAAEFATAHRLAAQYGFQAAVAAPMLREDVAIGSIGLRKKEPGPYTPRQIELLETFAAQAVIAIQNVRLFTEIQDKSRQLELASQHKSQFLANMSHELRTPLNAILGYTEMMVDGLYGNVPDKAQGVLERVQSNGRHLLGLINDVLDLSKIEAGQLSLSVEPYSVADMVATVLSATESLARTKGLALGSAVAPGLPTGAGDARRLTQVLLNLVGNAIKFTDRGSVEIRAALAGRNFELSVVDSGFGIAPEDQAKIFEEFQQVDNTSTRKKGGTGLGLSISRKIVELHGGAITVESEVGKGSTFKVAVPINVSAAKDAAQ